MSLERLRPICAVCMALALLGGIAGCGGDDGPSDEELRQAREEGEKEGRDRERLRDLERKLREQEKNDDDGDSGGDSGGGSPPRKSPSTSGTNCGDGVQAGPNTSCAFARNVRDEYYSAGGSGSITITVYSPTTDRSYAMECSGGSPHVCAGGNNASARFP